MLNYKKLPLLILAGLPVLASAQTKTDYFYLGDYTNSNLLGYKQTGSTYTNYGLNGSSTTPVIGSGIKEGIDGTANTILAVAGGVGVDGKTIYRYNRYTGVQLTNSSITGFSNIGNFTISSNAEYLYVADAGASQLDLVNLTTNQIVSHVSYAGAHDVTLSGDGTTAYVGTYNGSQGAYIGAYGITTNSKGAETGFTSEGNFLANAEKKDSNIAKYLTDPVGLTTDKNGDIWVENNVRGVGESIFAFDKNGNEILDFLDTKAASSTMGFTFGSDFGADGNLYIASLGSNYLGSGHGVSGVFEFNATQALAEWKAAGGAGTILTDTSGTKYGGYDTMLLNQVNLPSLPSGYPSKEGPKYIKFGTSFATGTDMGINPKDAGPAAVPEPSSIVIMAIGTAGFFLLRRRS